jgi:hypothetical protein
MRLMGDVILAAFGMMKEGGSITTDNREVTSVGTQQIQK